jgi:hypothetical protein
MGEYARDLNGRSNPYIVKYSIGASFAQPGILAEAPNAGEAGITPGTTTAVADCMGITLDTATYVTAQQTDGTSADRKVSVIVNPDAIYKFRMSGGATEGTALTLYPVTTASTDGLTITTASAWDSPTFDEGVAWGYDGANAGQVRKITSVSSTAGTVTVPFDYDTVVGDNFLRAPYWPGDTTAKTLQFTTNLYEADASIAVGTGASVVIVELECQDVSGDGRTKSFVYFMSNDHVFQTATA